MSAIDPLLTLGFGVTNGQVSDSIPRARNYAVFYITVIAYFARPWSCSSVISKFDTHDQVSYAHFDYHGVGEISAWLLGLLFAAPVLWLASKILLRPNAHIGLFGRGHDRRTTTVSVAIAAALAIPTFSQILYLQELPLSLTASVVGSSIVWMIVVEVIRTAAVKSGTLDRPVRRLAVALALLIAVPKLALLAIRTFGT